MDTCKLPGGWNFLAAAPAYSAFAGILGGFLFLGIVTLMTERDHSHGAKERHDDRRIASRERTLMLFLPALLSLLVASFLFGEVSGEQVCARGYVEGMIAASLLGIGGIGVFSGIVWMLDVYAASTRDLRLTAKVFTFISFFIVIALLADSGEDVIENAFSNNAPWYAIWPIIVYGPVLLILVAAVRLWFMPGDEKHSARARLTAVYFPASYVVVAVVLYSILTSYVPKDWPTATLSDWKTYLATSVALFFPGANLVIYARAIPGINNWQLITNVLRKWTTRGADQTAEPAGELGGGVADGQAPA
jgi:hypothetical protein